MKFGKLETKNPYFMTPVKTALAEPGSGKVTEMQIAYYRKRARGGIGAIILEPIAVLKNGKEHPKQLMMGNNLEGLKKLIAEIHRFDSLAIAHLNHAGRGANPKASGTPPISSSENLCPMTGQTAREMSPAEIQELISAFAENAKLAQEAGADGLEIQFGHGYIVNQFISPIFNRRLDEYGQDKMLLARKILEAVQSKTTLPIILRISGNEFTENSLTLEELGDIFKLAEEKEISAIHIGWGNVCDSPPWYYNHMSLPLQAMDKRIAEIRSLTQLPLIAAGRMQSNDRYLHLMESGLIQGVGFGRQLVVDPDFPGKIARNEDVIRCGGCLQGCLTSVKQGQAIGCIANPNTVSDEILTSASEKKKIAIIGGGPAGIYAGIYLQERGMEVSLFEQREKLGGQWNLVYKAPGKEIMKNTLDDLISMANKKLQINTSAKVDENFPLQSYDEIIIATGAEPAIPRIPGLENYLTGFDLYDQEELKGSRYLIIGGGLIGMEAAELLVDKGKEVVVVEMLEEVGRGMEPITYKLMMKKIGDKISIHTNSQVSRLESGEVFIKSDESEKSLGRFDGVVVAIGTRSVDGLYETIKAKHKSVHIVGDAKEVAQIMDATHSSYELAKSL